VRADLARDRPAELGELLADPGPLPLLQFNWRRGSVLALRYSVSCQAAGKSAPLDWEHVRLSVGLELLGACRAVDSQPAERRVRRYLA
jgi:hypothetical protein